MALLAIVREVLHDGNYGRTLLVKDESLIAIHQAVIHRSGCQSVEIVSPIVNKKAIEAFEVLTELNLSKLDKALVDIGHLLATPI